MPFIYFYENRGAKFADNLLKRETFRIEMPRGYRDRHEGAGYFRQLLRGRSLFEQRQLSTGKIKPVPTASLKPWST
jgi:hypothetical protein